VKLPESQGMYLTFAGLTQDQLVKAGGAGVKLFEAYKAKYGKDPDGSYPLYGVAAVQVILAAIAASDGTRKGVNAAVLSGSGITIPADQSVTGKEIKIDPATGDTSARDLTIEIVKDNKETFAKSQTIE
jgi:branched-chain amino acid transport system substrate-binding protein